MSAAATAAGYLYASGRLRGRTKEGEAQEPEPKARPRRSELRSEVRREVKVAVYEPSQQAQPEPVASRPKTAPKIQYRTRRWKPE